MTSRAMGSLEKIAGLFRLPHEPPETSVRLDDDGFAVMRGQEVLRPMLWSDVRKIVTYKRDLLACDQICVGLMGADEEDGVEVSEDTRGFQTFAEEMRRRFPSIPEDWFGEVMVPAFEQKWKVLFENGQDADRDDDATALGEGKTE